MKWDRPADLVPVSFARTEDGIEVESGQQASWFPFALDPATEAWRRAVLRAVMVAAQERPRRTLPVPKRIEAFRSLPLLRRWTVLIGGPTSLEGIARARATLVRIPEVVACRLEDVSSRTLRVALMTVELERDDVQWLVQQGLERSGCLLPVEVRDRESSGDDADLR